MSEKKPRPSKEDLIKAYSTPEASVNSLTKLFGLSHPLLRQLFAEYGIERKTASEITKSNSKTKIVPQKLSAKTYERLSDAKWLKEQVQNSKTIPAIAAELGCSVTPVIRALQRFNIQTDGRRLNVGANRCLEHFQWLHKAYTIDKKPMHAIAEEIGSSQATVQRWIHFHELDVNFANSYPRKQLKISSPVQELVDFIGSIYTGPVELNNRSICTRGLELDIVIPEVRLAIEYHGLFSHIYRPHEETFSRQKGPAYHLSKTTDAEHAGLKLYQFFSDEWRDKSDIIKSMIAVDIGVAQRIGARQCNPTIITTHEKNLFLDANHLQGSDRSKLKFGLEHQNELVAVMTFAKARFNKQASWELTRFAVKQNTCVVGGFSRLLAFARNNGVTGSIVSYADRRYSQGHVYEANGFQKITVNKPSYYYVDISRDSRMHRMHFQKKNLQGDKSKTEFELASEAGFHRIYDCGTITYMSV